LPVTTAVSTTTHTYMAVNTYSASVTVTDARGRTASDAKSVTIPAVLPGSYSVTVAASPTTIDPGTATTVTATVALRNGATAPTSFTFNCGVGADQTVTTNSVSCTYTTGGPFSPTVTATNGTTTGSATATTPVTIRTVDVTVACPAPLHNAPTSCNVSAKINGVSVTTEIASVSWNWEDGSAVEVITGTPLATHTWTGGGSFDVTAVVTLSGTHPGATGQGQIPITVP
jgi:PKD repeat protein